MSGMSLKKHKTFIIACVVMFVIDFVCSLSGAGCLLQIPSGWLAALFLGAPCCVDQDIVRIMVSPLLTVSEKCSGSGFFAFICGMGGAFFCGSKPLRWLVLLPLCYLIALIGNVARIVMAWHFQRLSEGRIPEWLQEYSHMGIGMACFLSITAVLLWVILPRSRLVRRSLGEDGTSATTKAVISVKL